MLRSIQRGWFTNTTRQACMDRNHSAFQHQSESNRVQYHSLSPPQHLRREMPSRMDGMAVVIGVVTRESSEKPCSGPRGGT